MKDVMQSDNSSIHEKRMGPGCYKNVDPQIIHKRIQCLKFSDTPKTGSMGGIDNFMHKLEAIRPMSAHVSKEEMKSMKKRILSNKR